MSTEATTIVLQIIRFHNCNRCTAKVVKELLKFDGVVLLAVDSITGKFTISTIKHPEVIRAALQQKFRKKSVILLLNCQGFNFQEMAQVMMTLPQAERIRNMELTPDGLRINFYEIRPSDVENVGSEYVPLPNTEPSAPPIPTSLGYAFAHPFRFRGYSAIIEDERPGSCCIIL